MTTAFGCNANTIKVVSGEYFDLADPHPDQVRIGDIAGALGKICRFGGHVPTFYSVAEHLCHCATLAEQDGLPAECVRAVFLHDAAEAYIGDMVKPLKIMLPEYSRIEARIEAAISQAFGVDFDKWHAAIKAIDQAMLIAERNALWPRGDGVKWTGESECRRITINPRLLAPADATKWFLVKWRKISEPIPDPAPLTPEEAQAAYDAAPAVPLSKERIEEIVRYATGKHPAPGVTPK